MRAGTLVQGRVAPGTDAAGTPACRPQHTAAAPGCGDVLAVPARSRHRGPARWLGLAWGSGYRQRRPGHVLCPEPVAPQLPQQTPKRTAAEPRCENVCPQLPPCAGAVPTAGGTSVWCAPVPSQPVPGHGRTMWHRLSPGKAPSGEGTHRGWRCPITERARPRLPRVPQRHQLQQPPAPAVSPRPPQLLAGTRTPVSPGPPGRSRGADVGWPWGGREARCPQPGRGRGRRGSGDAGGGGREVPGRSV